jgi:cytochrome c peroxidase
MHRFSLLWLVTASVVLAEGAPKTTKVRLPPSPAVPPAPKGLGELKAPDDNPSTPDRVDLGYKLFFDKRLSKDDSMACESCHHIDKAYSSGQAFDTKVGGKVNTRNAPSMLNLGYYSSFYWDGRMPTLEACSNAAWKGQLGADPDAVAAKLNAIPQYKAMFDRAFGGEAGATSETVPKALAAFLRALRSGTSRWDKFMAGNKKALSQKEQDGWETFKKSECIVCHAPPFFSDSDFHSAGIGEDPGRKDATKADADTNKFKTPSLRNVALTAPYFHDGRAATLDEAIKVMVGGGLKPGSDPKLNLVELSPDEMGNIKAFLESLTGESTFKKAPKLP